ncbi:hypothetical protein ACOJAM_12965, partial [Corynebacterium striatum]|uniref:hypothetical protein n=1 Tax=Corynebacterium striatum TaxID=43770 RepID=UPI003B5AF76C
NEHTTNTTERNKTNSLLLNRCAGVNYTKHKEYKKLHIPNNNTKSIIVWGCSRPLYSSHTTPQPPTTTTHQRIHDRINDWATPGQ